MLGMATSSPSTVVTSAVVIPGASVLRVAVPPAVVSMLKVSRMPHTVPSNPRNGAPLRAVATQLTMERVAGPVGEALIMTAAGLAVALPAVLAFNVMGRVINRVEQELATEIKPIPPRIDRTLYCV